MKAEFIDNYLYIELDNEVITYDVTKNTLNVIHERLNKQSVNKILVNATKCKHRDVKHEEVFELAKYGESLHMYNYFLAMWCNKNLIDKNAERYTIYTFKTSNTVMYFTEKEKALEWLQSRPESPIELPI